MYAAQSSQLYYVVFPTFLNFPQLFKIIVFMSLVLLDSDNGDYDYELSLEMKRQKIQRELMKLEQENMDKREEIIIKKEVYCIITLCLNFCIYTLKFE